jgi:indolepyruvate decarboxylase
MLDLIDSHDGAAYVEVMIPNEESQPIPEATIHSGYKIKTPEVG